MLKLVFCWLLPTRPNISGIFPLLCIPLFFLDPHQLWPGCLHCLPGCGFSNNSLGPSRMIWKLLWFLTPDCPGSLSAGCHGPVWRSCPNGSSPAC